LSLTCTASLLESNVHGDRSQSHTGRFSAHVIPKCSPNDIQLSFRENRVK